MHCTDFCPIKCSTMRMSLPLMLSATSKTTDYKEVNWVCKYRLLWQTSRLLIIHLMHCFGCNKPINLQYLWHSNTFYYLSLANNSNYWQEQLVFLKQERHGVIWVQHDFVLNQEWRKTWKWVDWKVNNGIMHLQQGCQTQFLEGRSPAEFSSNLAPTHKPCSFQLSLKDLISWIRCV